MNRMFVGLMCLMSFFAGEAGLSLTAAVQAEEPAADPLNETLSEELAQRLAELLLKEADAAAKAGKLADAIRMYEAYLESYPDSPAVRQKLTELKQQHTPSLPEPSLPETSAEPSPQTPLEIAKQLFAAGDYRAAQRWLIQANHQNPWDCEVRTLLAQTYLTQQDSLAAYNLTRNCAGADWETESLRRLTVGQSLANLGIYGDAEDALNSVLSSGNSQLQQRAGTALQKIQSGYYDAKRWRAAFRISEFFDDNPSVFPTANTFIPTIARDTSPGTSLGFNVAYDLLRNGNWDLTTDFHTQYLTFHDLSEFNVATFGTSATISHRDLLDTDNGAIPVTQAVRFGYDYLLLGSDSFLQKFDIGPGLLFQLTNTQAISTGFQFHVYDFLGQGINDNTFADQDSLSYQWTADWIQKFPDNNFSVTLGYALTWNESRGSDFDFFSQRIRCGARWDFHADWTLAWTGSIGWREYENPLFILGFNRSDDQYQSDLSLTYHLYDNADLFLQYTVDSNISNFPLTDYRREIIQAGLLMEL